MKKYLLAVSGGPDSMFLLNHYQQKDIVVAHVNYHKRIDSGHDEEIVRAFCKKHNIPLEVKDVSEKPNGNFQDWARKIRYDFFKEVYDKYNCDYLLTAHQKDDFLETAWMQMQSGRQPKFFGIKKKVELNGMHVYRPLIDWYWKDEIIKELQKKQIDYATDSTNSEPVYERNRVRMELASLPLKEKENRLSWFYMSNKILNKKNARVERIYKQWVKKNFELDFFRKLRRYQPEVIYELLHSEFTDIKVASTKLDGLVQFIMGLEGAKKYYIAEDVWVSKEKGFLVWEQKKERT